MEGTFGNCHKKVINFFRGLYEGKFVKSSIFNLERSELFLDALNNRKIAVITNSDTPGRSPDKQLVSSRPDCSPDLAKSNGLTRTHVSSLSNGSNGDAEYLEQRR